MSRPSPVAAVQVDPAPTVGQDWRVERMRGLVQDSDLAGEWDAERLVLITRGGGRVAGRAGCAAPDCPVARHGAGRLCRSHIGQFARSGFQTVEEWLAAGECRPLRRRASVQSCVVADNDDQRCPRPPTDTRLLCRAHTRPGSAVVKRG